MTKAAIDILTHIGNNRDEKVPVTFVRLARTFSDFNIKMTSSSFS
ncbi:hypothetical protein HMPREF3038_03060 [Akkermansia sp. KLE1797]|nr:hypothetical protein HMPREF3038_03060 [Akkermansia sp. KLE1797]